MHTCQVCNYSLSIGKLTSQENTIVVSDANEFIKMFNSKSKKKT